MVGNAAMLEKTDGFHVIPLAQIPQLYQSLTELFRNSETYINSLLSWLQTGLNKITANLPVDIVDFSDIDKLMVLIEDMFGSAENALSELIAKLQDIASEGNLWERVWAMLLSLFTSVKNLFIGLFIAFIGMQNAGIIVNSDATLVALGEITKGSALLAIIGLVITGVLYVRNVRGAMLIGILATTLIGIPMGITEFKGVVSAPESIAPIFCKFEWKDIWSLDMFVVVFTFLFIDLFDTMGTLIGVCTKADMMDQKTGRIPRLKQAFMADAIATTVGAVLGTSTTTTYVESAAGVAQGGRSGLTALVIACCFAVTLFLSPLFLSIPSAATAPVLILVGLLMIEPVTKIDFVNFTESIPAFICIIMMPLAYSVSDGILTGMIFYVAINMASGKLKRVTPTMFILAVLFILKYIFF